MNIDLTKHLRMQTGEKPYQCSNCDEDLSHNGHLTNHLRTYTGGKSYQCSNFYQILLCTCVLTDHVNRHTGEKPYLCSHREKSFPLIIISQNISLYSLAKSHINVFNEILLYQRMSSGDNHVGETLAIQLL